jgi:aspartate racemase
MKTIGLIGGTSWVSTIDYYRGINQISNERLGGLHTVRILLYSVNFAEIKPDLTADWMAIGKKLSAIAQTLENAGAECLLICANSMHMAADIVQANIQIPLIHIGEETAKEIKRQRIKKAGLLGTQVTMEESFLKRKLSDYGIETLIPDPEDRYFVNSSIFSELNKGVFPGKTKERYVHIIHKLVERGAEGIILGCTEIPSLIKQEDCPVPAFDTTMIHARAAVTFALNDDRDN